MKKGDLYMAIEIIDKSKCSGCSACFSVCPKRCIVMREDKEGFLYPSIDDKNCIHCGLCERICPIKNRYLPPDNKDIIAIAAQLKDDSLRLNSSSGGVFTAIAEEVIKRGGVVFGAAFNKNLGVRHIYTETKEGLSQIRGSKYLQSIIGDAYKQAEHFLKNGRQVFFTGTPCQIGGLYAYLGENYDNLITQDLVCHGVPSPLVWGKYLTYRKKEAGANVENVFFRDKRVGWKKYSISLKFSNQTEYSETITPPWPRSVL